MKKCSNILRKKNNLDLEHILESEVKDILSEENTAAQIGYIIFFIHPITGKPIYLARDANISDICYSDNPKLPGTGNINLSKLYNCIEDAKSDVYKLRYHHREFINVLTCIKKVAQISCILHESEIHPYAFYELKSNILPLEIKGE